MQKVNFQTFSYGAATFSGAAQTPNYQKSNFGLTADSLATLHCGDDGEAFRFRFFMEKRGTWSMTQGLDMAEFHIVPELDLRAAPLSAAFLGAGGDFKTRDVLHPALLVVKTPAGVYQLYIGENSRGAAFEDDLLSFTALGQYQISLLFASWYRLNQNLSFGAVENQYHVFTHTFTVPSDGRAGGQNAVDGVPLAGNEVLRPDARSGKIERQKRADDFYYWTDCAVESVTYDFTNSTGQKFYNVAYTYGGRAHTQSVREEYVPVHPVTFP